MDSTGYSGRRLGDAVLIAEVVGEANVPKDLGTRLGARPTRLLGHVSPEHEGRDDRRPSTEAGIETDNSTALTGSLWGGSAQFVARTTLSLARYGM
jgi:hypothetical protein